MNTYILQNYVKDLYILYGKYKLKTEPMAYLKIV